MSTCWRFNIPEWRYSRSVIFLVRMPSESPSFPVPVVMAPKKKTEKVEVHLLKQTMITGFGRFGRFLMENKNLESWCGWWTNSSHAFPQITVLEHVLTILQVAGARFWESATMSFGNLEFCPQLSFAVGNIYHYLQHVACASELSNSILLFPNRKKFRSQRTARVR